METRDFLLSAQDAHLYWTEGTQGVSLSLFSKKKPVFMVYPR